MRKKSFIHTLSVLMGIQLLTVTMIVVAFTVLTYQSAEREMDLAAQNLLNVYAAQMENRVIKMEQNLSAVLENDADLSLLESAVETDRHYASIRLCTMMKNLMKIDDSAELIVIAEAEYGTCLDANNSELSLKEKEEARGFVMEYARNGKRDRIWKFEIIGDKVYLYKILIWGKRAIAAFVSADALLEMTSDVKIKNGGFVLTDGEDDVWGAIRDGIFTKSIKTDFAGLSSRHMMINQVPVIEGQIKLYSFEKKIDVFLQFRSGAVLLLGAVILLCIFDYAFTGIIRKELIMPMNEMRKDMKHIEQGEYHLRVKEMGNNQEFSMLALSFNKLMDEILSLRIQFYEKKLELSDTEQKYIRLQIRPHFFLNALSTISGLSSQDKNRDIEIYISALSKNIRYMFGSGLHTVSVKEEIRHVENYFEMQELKYPECMFYYIELPEELESWKIPQMLIHTLVENEYKYAVSMDTSLMLLIKISVTEIEGERMLVIEVEDDGPGYPTDVLEYINQDTERGQDGTRVGLYSIKRLLELMYDRKHLFLIENIEPHGALNRIYVPEHAVNERSRDDLREAGID
ncbi:MAG: histidine kinase [Eubacterium sp.]|nr:histidine kinase [Eubacterium sp.]